MDNLERNRSAEQAADAAHEADIAFSYEVLPAGSLAKFDDLPKLFAAYLGRFGVAQHTAIDRKCVNRIARAGMMVALVVQKREA